MAEVIRDHAFAESWLGDRCDWSVSAGTSNDRCGQPGKDHAYKTNAEAIAGMREEAKAAYAQSQYEQAAQNDAEASKPSAAVMAFTAHADDVLQLVAAKDRAYGGAWREQGYMGNLARIKSKTARLNNMLWKDDPSDGIGVSVGGESVGDTLRDLMALAAFMLTNFEEGNRWGK